MLRSVIISYLCAVSLLFVVRAARLDDDDEQPGSMDQKLDNLVTQANVDLQYQRLKASGSFPRAPPDTNKLPKPMINASHMRAFDETAKGASAKLQNMAPKPVDLKTADCNYKNLLWKMKTKAKEDREAYQPTGKAAKETEEEKEEEEVKELVDSAALGKSMERKYTPAYYRLKMKEMLKENGKVVADYAEKHWDKSKYQDPRVAGARSNADCRPCEASKQAEQPVPPPAVQVIAAGIRGVIGSGSS